MDSIIHIKCPVCGKVIPVIDDPSNVKKVLTCPNCHEKVKFVDCKVVSPADAAAPEAPSPSPAHPQQTAKSTDATRIEIPPKREAKSGYFEDRMTGMRYDLPAGKHVLGRNASTSKADIPIETADRYMSRAHIRVDVSLGEDGLYHVYVSNAENTNPTLINGVTLQAGEVVGLKSGDVLKLGDTELKYVDPSADRRDMTVLPK